MVARLGQLTVPNSSTEGYQVAKSLVEISHMYLNCSLRVLLVRRVATDSEGVGKMENGAVVRIITHVDSSGRAGRISIHRPDCGVGTTERKTGLQPKKPRGCPCLRTTSLVAPGWLRAARSSTRCRCFVLR